MEVVPGLKLRGASGVHIIHFKNLIPRKSEKKLVLTMIQTTCTITTTITLEVGSSYHC